jgi:hypothetical protein
VRSILFRLAAKSVLAFDSPSRDSPAGNIAYGLYGRPKEHTSTEPPLPSTCYWQQDARLRIIKTEILYSPYYIAKRRSQHQPKCCSRESTKWLKVRDCNVYGIGDPNTARDTFSIQLKLSAVFGFFLQVEYSLLQEDSSLETSEYK